MVFQGLSCCFEATWGLERCMWLRRLGGKLISSFYVILWFLTLLQFSLVFIFYFYYFIIICVEESFYWRGREPLFFFFFFFSRVFALLKRGLYFMNIAVVTEIQKLVLCLVIFGVSEFLCLILCECGRRRGEGVRCWFLSEMCRNWILMSDRWCRI